MLNGNAKKFSETLVSLRKKAGLSQRQLADALGVTESTIANWENGRHKPRLLFWQFKAFCQALGIQKIDEIPDDLELVDSSDN